MWEIFFMLYHKLLPFSGLHGRNCVCQVVATKEKSHNNPVFQERGDLPDQRPVETDVPGGQRQTLPAARVAFQRNHPGKDYNRRRHLDKVSCKFESNKTSSGCPKKEEI